MAGMANADACQERSIHLNEDQRLSAPTAERVHNLLEEDGSPFAAACLLMMDEGMNINDASATAGTDMFQLMRQWHEFADAHGITANDGSRPCIHVLAQKRP